MGQRTDQKGNKKNILSENTNTTHQNLQDAAKTVLRGKFVVVKIYIKKKKVLK